MNIIAAAFVLGAVWTNGNKVVTYRIEKKYTPAYCTCSLCTARHDDCTTRPVILKDTYRVQIVTNRIETDIINARYLLGPDEEGYNRGAMYRYEIGKGPFEREKACFLTLPVIKGKPQTIVDSTPWGY